MKKLTLLPLLFLSGCAGMYMDYRPITTDDNKKGYSIHTVFGGLGGNKEQASEAVSKRAKHLCSGDFEKISEEVHKRLTIWGAENGQIDLFWEVKCL